MYKIVAKVDGMMCGMCETHVQEAVRKAFPVKQVKASHTKNRLELLSDAPLAFEELKAAIEPTGYEVASVACEPYQKKKIFSKLFR